MKSLKKPDFGIDAYVEKYSGQRLCATEETADAISRALVDGMSLKTGAYKTL